MQESRKTSSKSCAHRKDCLPDAVQFSFSLCRRVFLKIIFGCLSIVGWSKASEEPPSSEEMFIVDKQCIQWKRRGTNKYLDVEMMQQMSLAVAKAARTGNRDDIEEVRREWDKKEKRAVMAAAEETLNVEDATLLLQRIQAKGSKAWGNFMQPLPLE